MKRNTFRRPAAILLMLCMLLAMLVIPVNAVGDDAETGNIKIIVDPSFEGLPLYLISIGSYENGKVMTDQEYVDIGADIEEARGSGALMEAAEKAAAYVKEKGIKGEVGRIDIDGEVNFYNVPFGKLYLVMQPIGEEIVKIQPMILTMPAMTPDNVPYSDITINAKCVDSGLDYKPGALILHKLGKENKPLRDAVFTFWRKVYYTDASKLKEGVETGEDETGSYYWKKFGTELTTDKYGMIFISEMPLSDFRYAEVKAPEGYILDSKPYEFTIDQGADIKVENGVVKTLSGKAVEIDVYNKPKPDGGSVEPVSDISIIPEENPPEDQPSKSEQPGGNVFTGEDIKNFIMIGGAVLVSLAVIILLVLLGTRKKRKDE